MEETYTLTLDRQDGSEPFQLYEGDDVDKATDLFRSLAPLIDGAAVVLTNGYERETKAAQPAESKPAEAPKPTRVRPGHQPQQPKQ